MISTTHTHPTFSELFARSAHGHVREGALCLSETSRTTLHLPGSLSVLETGDVKFCIYLALIEAYYSNHVCSPPRQSSFSWIRVFLGVRCPVLRIHLLRNRVREAGEIVLDPSWCPSSSHPDFQDLDIFNVESICTKSQAAARSRGLKKRRTSK